MPTATAPPARRRLPRPPAGPAPTGRFQGDAGLADRCPAARCQQADECRAGGASVVPRGLKIPPRQSKERRLWLYDAAAASSLAASLRPQCKIPPLELAQPRAGQWLPCGHDRGQVERRKGRRITQGATVHLHGGAARPVLRVINDRKLAPRVPGIGVLHRLRPRRRRVLPRLREGPEAPGSGDCGRPCTRAPRRAGPWGRPDGTAVSHRPAIGYVRNGRVSRAGRYPGGPMRCRSAASRTASSSIRSGARSSAARRATNPVR